MSTLRELFDNVAQKTIEGGAAEGLSGVKCAFATNLKKEFEDADAQLKSMYNGHIWLYPTMQYLSKGEKPAFCIISYYKNSVRIPITFKFKTKRGELRRHYYSNDCYDYTLVSYNCYCEGIAENVWEDILDMEAVAALDYLICNSSAIQADKMEFEKKEAEKAKAISDNQELYDDAVDLLNRFDCLLTEDKSAYMMLISKLNDRIGRVTSIREW